MSSATIHPTLATATAPTRLHYDAILIVSFGGPEGMADVEPFLRNVLRGRNVPPERMREVAAHYEQFGGVSPINGHNRALISALRDDLRDFNLDLPVYWGNRNWHPTLPNTLARMASDGISNALAFFTSAYGSYSGCRQYMENIQDARQQAGPDAPEVHRLRAFFNHPGFIGPNIELVREAFDAVPPDRRSAARLVFTAHSIPLSMAASSPYESQLRETASLVAAGAGVGAWDLVYQSRSGPPAQPWLEPDINDHLRALASSGVRDVILSPVGFLSDHMEVLFDLDTEARALAGELDINLVRAGTVGVHADFINMICELVIERQTPETPRRSLGSMGPAADICADTCCVPVARPR